MKIILFVIGIFMIVATTLPLLPKDQWWIRGFDFPRLQIMIGITLILAGYASFITSYTVADQFLLIALTLSLCYQIYMVFPYTLLGPEQVQKSSNSNQNSSLSLLCANVQMDNRHATELKDIIEKTNPDIILAIETDDWWIEQLNEIESDYPHTVKQPQDNMYGIALYSRLNLIDPEVKFRVQDDIPSISAKTKLQSEVEVILHCLHPRPPFPTGSDTSSERDAELLIVGKEIKDLDAPTIVLGDMNDVAWSKTNYLFQDISGLLDPRAGRGFFNTFHAKYPFIRFPLDHFFHSRHFRLSNFKRLDNFGSDHFPVYIELSYEPSASITQEEKEANQTEEEEAEQKIEKGT